MAAPQFPLRIQRAYAAPGDDDGARVLVDRLWPRGLRREEATLTLWLKDIAPSPDLRRWFGHAPARFAEFSQRYRAELAANPGAVGRIEELMARGPVTLLYAAHDPVHNHAQVLLDYLQDRHPA